MWSPKFTDEDLDKLKKCVIPETQKLDVGFFDWSTYSPVAVNLAALVTRLEAAEIAMRTLAEVHGDCKDGDCAEVLEVWRRAVGKGK